MKSEILNLKSAADPAKLLLQHFDSLAEAPGAISKLRALVLDLAVRGKLAPQDSNDQPVSELLKNIRAETGKGGSTKNTNPPSNVSPNGIFQIPANWTWVPLGAITNIVMGQSPPGESYNKSGEGVPLINGPVEFTEDPFGKTTINQYTTAPTNFCDKGDLLLCVRGSTTGRTNIAALRACIGRGVAAIQPLFPDAYVRLCVWRLRESIISMGRGVAFPSISRQQIEELPIPLPPLLEQRRIVAKVEELLALCDQLETRQTAAREHRTRLVRSALDHLTTAKSDQDFQKHVSFILHKSAAILESVSPVRLTTLSLAFQGRLASQDAGEGTGPELLRAIDVTKRQKRCTSVSKPLGTTEPLWKIPPSWIWCRLADVYDVRDGTHDTPKYVEDGTPLVTSKNLYTGQLDLTDVKLISKQDHARICERSKVDRGDVLFAMIGSIGNPVLVDTDREFSIKNVALFKYYSRTDSEPHFLRLYLTMASQRMREIAAGGVQSFVSLGFLRQYPIPLPPLPEQKRIVAKVDELMSWCEQLEKRLITAQSTATQTLDAALRQVTSE